MRLIPVIDLMRGQAVRAVRGERSTYQPLRSRLCVGAEPVAVARALLAHCHGRTLYLADLDALQGGEVQVAALQALLLELPHCELWLDAGLADRTAANALLARLGALADRITPVYASESLRNPAALQALFDASDAAGPLLSLDRRQGQHLDAAQAWQTPAAWPRRVIVMTLERVGAGSGPDLSTLAQVQALSPKAQLIGAGGVRSLADLAAARAAGAHAWLVASALHDGSIGADELAAFQRPARVSP
ncbi:MAG: nickel transporter [Burkholderiales bacterium]|nr:nickel transporter [Burkholderiales bacterium]